MGSDAAYEVCGRVSGKGREGRRVSVGDILSEGSRVNAPRTVGRKAAPTVWGCQGCAMARA